VSYSLLILRRAQSELAALPQETYEKLKSAISALSENSRPHGCKKLAGRQGWRIGVGAYRVIYEVDGAERTVIILHVGHRRDVYR
jgi:mRNA interferase RelE/StbE